MIGLYIHVPFCARKCAYCDFYSLPYTEEAADTYTEAVLRAVKTQPFGRLRADTLYFGGGTPALLGAKRLGRILDSCAGAFGLDGDCEITAEANPASSMGAALRDLRTAGFTRISFGVQSLEDGELRALGRLHTADDARAAISAAADVGFRDISADLMLAVPGQTAVSLLRSVEGLTALPIHHISAYLLKLEAGTPLHARADSLDLPDEDAQADLYLGCVERLAEYGFAQYEISSFAREGRVARHNLKYWRCEEYLGIGPAAHSFLGGRRFCFPRDLCGFTEAERPFQLAVDDGPGGGFEEAAMLALRLTEGLDIQKAPPALVQRARGLERHGLAAVGDGRIALTPRGFLVSNTAIAHLLGS